MLIGFFNILRRSGIPVSLKELMDLLEAYLKAGGAVICCGPPPERIEGRLSDRGQKASRHPGLSQGREQNEKDIR